MTPIYARNRRTKAGVLPRMAAGTAGLLRADRPDHGSDPGRMLSRARNAAGGWVLTGTKLWITHAPIADIMIVWAKDDAGVIRGFILERGMEGLSTRKIEGKFSVRASPTGDFIWIRVRSGRTAAARCEGLKAPFGCLNNARFGICWGASVGRSLLAHRAAVHDRPAAVRQTSRRHPLIQKKLADMQTEIGLGLLACLHVCRLRERAWRLRKWCRC